MKQDLLLKKQFLKSSWSEVYFLTIGTEFNIRYGWVVVIYQGFQALPRGRVPNTTEAVIRWGYCKQRNKIILSWFSNRWRYLMIFSLISIRILAWCQACHEINHLNICSHEFEASNWFRIRYHAWNYLWTNQMHEDHVKC